jgi:hypothetical protein
LFLDLGGLSLRRDKELKLATGAVEVAVRDADISEEDCSREWYYESMGDESLTTGIRISSFSIPIYTRVLSIQKVIGKQLGKHTSVHEQPPNKKLA